MPDQTISPATQVNTTTSGNQVAPDVASFGSAAGVLAGGHVVVFEDRSGADGNGRGIFGQLFGADGQPVGSQFQISGALSGNQERPSVAVLTDGSFVVAYDGPNASGGAAVILQRYDFNEATGQVQTVGNAEIINYTPRPLTENYPPEVTALSDGGYALVLNSGNNTFGRVFSANGAPEGNFIPLGFIRNTSASQPNVVELEGGRLLFTFTLSNSNGSGASAYYRIFNQNGSSVTNIVRMIDGGRFSVAEATQDGGFFGIAVVGTNLVGQFFNASGSETTAEFTLASGVAIATPDLVRLEDGTFVVTYERGGDIYAQQVGTNGLLIGDEIIIDAAVNIQSAVQADLLENGDIIITYQSGAVETPNTSFGIATRVVSFGNEPEPEPLGPPPSLPQVNTGEVGDQVNADVASFGPSAGQLAGGRIVVFEDQNGLDGEGSGIYGQLYDANGQPISVQFQISVDLGGDQELPSVTVLNDGSFVVAYYGLNVSNANSLFIHRFTYNETSGEVEPVGNVFETSVTFTIQSEGFAPEITALTDGGYVAVFSVGVNTFAQVFDASGNTEGGFIEIGFIVNNGASQPNVIELEGGNLVFTFTLSNSNGSGPSTYYRIFDQNGTALTGIEQMIGGARFGVAAATADGGFFGVSAAGGQLVGQFFDATGNETTAEFTFASGVANATAAVVRLEDATFVVTYERGGDVFAQRVGTDGLLIGNEVVIDAAANIQSAIEADLLENGDIVVAYQSQAVEADGTDFGIASRTISFETLDAVENGAVVPAPFGPPPSLPQVNTGEDGNQANPDVASFGASAGVLAGGRVVVFEDQSGLDGDGSGVYGQLYTANDQPIGVQFRINDAPLGDQELPSVTVLNDGSFVVAYYGLNVSNTSSLFAQRFTFNETSGNVEPVGGLYEAPVNFTLVSEGFAPEVTALADGGYVTVFNSGVNTFAQVFDANGNPEGGVIATGFIVNNNGSQPNIIELEGGNLVFTFTLSNSNGSAPSTYYRIFNQDGTSVTGITELTAGGRFGVAAATEDGGFLGVSIVGGQLVGQFFDAAGTETTTEFTVATGVADATSAVIRLFDGTFVVTYERGGDLFARRIDTDGSSIGDEIVIDATANIQSTVEADVEGGDVVFTYQSQSVEAGGTDFGIASRVIRTEISGQTTGAVVEDDDPDGDGLLEEAGVLIATEIGNVPGTFAADTILGVHGTFSIDAAGNWTYEADNNALAIQSLGEGDTLTETFTVSTLDDVEQVITITITGTNDVAIIGGVASGAVTEDIDPDGDGLLEVTGALTVTDIDTDEDAFVPGTLNGAYGNLTIDANGNWAYSTDNAQAAIQSLDDGETLTDTITVATIDGTTQDVTITINGTNDAPVASDVDLGAIDEDTSRVITEAELLANSSDIDASDTLSVTSVSVDAATGSIVDNGDGTFTFTPVANFNGDDVAISFTVSDGDLTDTATALVDVSSVNDVPTSGAATVTTDEDIAYIFTESDFPFADVDVNDSLQSVRIDSLPAVGSLSLSGTALTAGAVVAVADIVAGNLVFTPEADANGTGYASFTFSVSDGGLFTAVPSTLTIDVTPVNDAPVAQAGTLAATEDGASVAGTLVASDVDGDGLSYALVAGSEPAEGSVVVNPDGSFSFDPGSDFQDLAAGETRDVSFDFEVTDGNGGSDTETVTVTVTGTNDAAIVGGDVSGAVTEDVDPDGDGLLETSGVLTVTDADNGEASFVAETLAGLYGSLTIDAAGNWTYEADNSQSVVQALGGGESLSDVLTVTTAEGTTQNVTITINGVNDAPIAEAGTLAATEDGDPVAGTLVASDVDGDSLSYALVAGSEPAEGSVVVNLDGSFSFDPGSGFQDLAAGETREVSFNFEVTDGNGGSDTETVTITVTGTNDAPVVSSVDLGAVDEDASLVITSAQLLANSSDADVSDPLSVTSVSVDPGVGTVTDNGNGTFTFTPVANFNGNDVVINFTVSDGTVSDTATALIDITSVNDAPIAQAGTLAATEDGGLVAGTLVASDADGDSLSYALVAGSEPAEGSVVVNLDGSFSFDPGSDFQDLAAGETREVSFNFEVTDGNGGSDTETVTITVTGTNDAPVVSSVNLGAVDEDTSRVITETELLAGASDADGSDTLTVTSVSVDPAIGTITDNGDGTFTFTPVANVNGDNIEVAFTVSDGADTTAGTATLNLTAVADAAVISGVATGAVTEDVDPDGNGLLETSGVLTVTDPDAGEAGFIAQTLVGTLGSLTIDANGNWTYAADNSQAAIQSLAEGETAPAEVFTVTTIDGTEQQITIDVIGTNEAPVAFERTVRTVEGGDVIEGTLVGYDEDDGSLSFSLVSAPAEGAVTISQDGTFTFDVGNDFQDLTFGQSRDVTFTYAVDDNQGAANSVTEATITITVQGASDTPIVGISGGRIDGTASSDHIIGSAFADDIRARDSDDIVEGGDGNDTIFGGSENDLIFGGAGNDTILGGGNDPLASSDTLHGGTGDDDLNAGVGTDVVYGGAGNDIIINGPQVDLVDGGSGDDTLFSGVNDDNFVGGAGADRFVFNDNIGQNRVWDFSVSEDILELSGNSELTGATRADVIAASSEEVIDGFRGVLIDLGPDSSVFLVGLSLNDLNTINLVTSPV